MNWLTNLVKRRGPFGPSRDRLQGAVDAVAAPPNPITFPAPTTNWGAITHPVLERQATLVKTFGDFEVYEYANHTAAVRFESDCQCFVNLHCASRTAAIYLATALNMCAAGSTVDIDLDRAFT